MGSHQEAAAACQCAIGELVVHPSQHARHCAGQTGVRVNRVLMSTGRCAQFTTVSWITMLRVRLADVALITTG